MLTLVWFDLLIPVHSFEKPTLFLEIAKPQKRWLGIEIELKMSCSEHGILLCVTCRVDAFIGHMCSLAFHSPSAKWNYRIKFQDIRYSIKWPMEVVVGQKVLFFACAGSSAYKWAFYGLITTQAKWTRVSRSRQLLKSY